MTENQSTQPERTELSQDEMLSTILQKLTSQGNSAPVSNGADNPPGNILSLLLSNPEMLAKLPTLLSSVKPIIDMLGSGNLSASASAPVSAPASQAASVPLGITQNKGADSRSALLCAMKPYLSRDRQNAIDYIIKLGRLGDILKTL